MTKTPQEETQPSTCFVIMPITTPESVFSVYNDRDHFRHVLELLFIPAITAAGFEPITPISAGSNLIQADVIGHLSAADIVLCDMSLLNANVFFELGIRTALNKPVALVVDDRTDSVPFDTHIVNRHHYAGALTAWDLDRQRELLTAHLEAASRHPVGANALWKYFGIAQVGALKTENVPVDAKLDFIIEQLTRPRYRSPLRLLLEEKKEPDATRRTANSETLVQLFRETIRRRGRDGLVEALNMVEEEMGTRPYDFDRELVHSLLAPSVEMFSAPSRLEDAIGPAETKASETAA